MCFCHTRQAAFTTFNSAFTFHDSCVCVCVNKKGKATTDDHISDR